MKEWRSLQIAATILYRLCGDINIESVNTIFYDLKVKIKDSNLYFAVKVGSSSFIKNVSYETYTEQLRNSYIGNVSNFIPVILMCINENTETATWGFQVGWMYNKPIILDRIKQSVANEKSWALLYDHIKSMDNTIRILSEFGMKIIKTLDIETIYREQTCNAKIIYLRDFSDKYKMKQTSPATDEERFHRMMYGIPEEEYPRDELDDIICQSVNSKYRINSVYSKLLLFSSELRDLQVYRDFRHEECIILVEPIFSLPMQPLLEEIKIPHITLDIFPNLSFGIEAFQNVSLSYSISMERWIKCYNQITANIETIHRVHEFLQ